MRDIGRLEALWIYPVKSLAAVPLQETRVEPQGLPGDRERALIVREGHAREGKTYRGKEHNLLHLSGSAERAAALAAVRGVRTTLEYDPERRFFDARPVSVLFDIWVDQASRGLGRTLDPLRWRPNFFARASDGFTMREHELTGAIIEIGEVALRVIEPIDRCVTTSYDVQTGEPDNNVLRYVAQERNNAMGIYCEVELAGTVRAGDVLRLRAR